MWTPIDLDGIGGRIRAVSAPDERQTILVLTDTGLYGVWFSRSATVLRLTSAEDAERVIDLKTGGLTRQGVQFRVGGQFGTPVKRFALLLPQTTPHGDTLEIDPAGRVTVSLAEGSTFQPTDLPVRTDRWSVVGFSSDGRYLIVADEWDVRLFRHTPKKGGQKPAWANRGVTNAPLLKSIAANPDDDLPRLVYADWLDENGDPARGHLIRYQCEQAKAVRTGLPYPGDSEVQQLLQSHGDRWAAEYPVIRGLKWSGFWRGFPCVTALSGTALARQVNKVWTAAPVESMVLSRLSTADATALAKCLHLDRVRILELKNVLAVTDLGPIRGFGPARRWGTRLLAPTALAELLSRLTGLWWLAFGGGCSVGAEGCRAIADCAAMRTLEVLGLRWCQLNDDAAEALIESPHLPRLRELDLRGNEFGESVPPRLRKRFPTVML